MFEPSSSADRRRDAIVSTEPVDGLLELWSIGQRPNLQAFLTERDVHSPTQIADAIRVDQDQRWQIGELPLAETYLQVFPQVGQDAELAVDVIFNEYLLRQQWHVFTDLEQFVARFPTHGDALKDQIEFHAALESGPALSKSDAETSDESKRLGQVPSDDTPSASTTGHVPPVKFGRYRLLKVLGSGGMGTVYAAEDSELGRQVALKIPKQCRTDRNSEIIERFYREARVAARLAHPHLCPIHDIGRWRGIYYLTMPLLKGETLAAWIRRERRIESLTAVRWCRQIAEAVEVVHEAGVIHRDLKPANIMISPAGDAIVMDYGLVRQNSIDDPVHTSVGVVLGTPSYVAPERISPDEGVDWNHAVDIYALGVYQ